MAFFHLSSADVRLFNFRDLVGFLLLDCSLTCVITERASLFPTELHFPDSRLFFCDEFGRLVFTKRPLL